MANYSSIVVGVDFTECSATALRHAIRIAASSGAALHVVHIIDTRVVIDLEESLSALQQGIQTKLLEEARNAWARFAKGIEGAAGLPIEIAVNNRVVGLLARARDDRADLLVLGAFGDRRPDVGFGTVANSCVRTSKTDVLLVRDTPQGRGAGPFKKIVAAVDFSDTSLRAFERAAMFAARDSAELHLLHVFEDPWKRLHYISPPPPIEPDVQRELRGRLAQRLEQFCGPALKSHPGLRVQHEILDHSGHRSGIVAYADKISADLVALGTRGKTNLRDILLGSTAEKTLAESRCSVLAIHAKGVV